MSRLFYDPAGEEWCPEFYRKLAASKAFRRARMAALLRRTVVLVGHCAAGDRRLPRRSVARVGSVHGLVAGEGWHTIAVGIDEVVGLASADGARKRALPLLPRSSREAWRRLYTQPDPPQEQPIRVVADQSGYYLTAPRDVLLVELLRAKGISSVWVNAAVPPMGECRAPRRPGLAWSDGQPAVDRSQGRHYDETQGECVHAARRSLTLPPRGRVFLSDDAARLRRA